MSKTTVCLRPAQREDDRFILRVNAENVEVLSPLDGDRLNKLAGAAELCLVAEVGGTPAAFLIALRESVDFYDSENYRWFSRNYEKFLYIDRVVIDEPFRGRGEAASCITLCSSVPGTPGYPSSPPRSTPSPTMRQV